MIEKLPFDVLWEPPPVAAVPLTVRLPLTGSTESSTNVSVVAAGLLPAASVGVASAVGELVVAFAQLYVFES